MEPILIPLWIFIVFVPMFFSIIIMLLSNARNQGMMKTDIKYMNSRLYRIEKLLDKRQQISETINKLK